jgi:hypothetical protein
LEEAICFGTPQPSSIHKQNDIGRTFCALAFKPFDERIVRGFDPVNFDTSRLREIVVERLVSVIVTRRVQIKLSRFVSPRRGKRG